MKTMSMKVKKAAPKTVKAVKVKPVKAGKDVNTDALEAPHVIKPHHYRYK